MRLGTTSYIYPTDIITNVRKLIGKVDDVELVLFDVDEGENKLPDAGIKQELIHLATSNEMTYTVHLPLDLRLADRDNADSLRKAEQVIRSMMDLNPWGFVVHLESQYPRHYTTADWVEHSLWSLEALSCFSGDPALLCVENLENQPPHLIDTILDRIPVSCCVDVGHMWKEGVNPAPLLEKRLKRTRIVHLHGVKGRDHKRLSSIPPTLLDPVIRLLNERFNGVVTLEIFSESSWLDSVVSFDLSVKRIRMN